MKLYRCLGDRLRKGRWLKRGEIFELPEGEYIPSLEWKYIEPYKGGIGMKLFRCVRTCQYRGQLWKPGDLLEVKEDFATTPIHFVDISPAPPEPEPEPEQKEQKEPEAAPEPIVTKAKTAKK